MRCEHSNWAIISIIIMPCRVIYIRVYIYSSSFFRAYAMQEFDAYLMVWRHVTLVCSLTNSEFRRKFCHRRPKIRNKYRQIASMTHHIIANYHYCELRSSLSFTRSSSISRIVYISLRTMHETRISMQKITHTKN